MFEALLPPARKRRQKTAAPATPKPTRADSNAVLRKEIGKRMIEARTINGWDQSESAKLFGYRNSTQLSLIEQGKRLPPHEILIKASEIYGVSLDFLFAMTEEPERDPKAAERNAAMRHVNNLVSTSTQQMVGMLMQYLAQGVPSIKVSTTLLDKAQELSDEVRRTRELNTKLFDEKLKNGSKLVRAAVSAAEACTIAREMLTRHERLMEFKNRAEEARKGVSHPLFDAADADLVQRRLM